MDSRGSVLGNLVKQTGVSVKEVLLWFETPPDHRTTSSKKRDEFKKKSTYGETGANKSSRRKSMQPPRRRAQSTGALSDLRSVSPFVPISSPINVK